MATQIIFGNIKETLLPGGQKMIHGLINIGTYVQGATTSGVQMNMSNYFLSTATPIVIVCSKGGYVFDHNNGTVASGLLAAKITNMNAKNGLDVNQVLGPLANGTDLSTTETGFIAVAQAY
jgi:hypothetical protein